MIGLVKPILLTVVAVHATKTMMLMIANVVNLVNSSRSLQLRNVNHN
jgi:hypothetical protein